MIVLAGFLRDVTNKGTQLEVMRDWFNAVMYQSAIRATEDKAPLSYKEVEDLMKRELRTRHVYEYPRYDNMERRALRPRPNQGDTTTPQRGRGEHALDDTNT